jgi:ketosteroid isomerase-like protein
VTGSFDAAIAAIDAANADDPNLITVRGRTGPKEILHAELVTAWVRELTPDPSEPLLLAARGHHLRRWTVPRSSYPTGRAGYLRWRRDLHEQHATELGGILAGAGYDDETIARVQAIVRKQHLQTDPEVQVFEDALCLVFLETQLTDIAARLDPAKLASVIVKTARKMSPAGIDAIARVPLDVDARTILDRAIGPVAVVHRYLDAVATNNWDAVAATLADDIERDGPYGDDYRGRDTYAAFLRDTISALSGYELGVERVIAATIGDATTVLVELHETVDAEGGRLRTDEAVVFDVRDDLITRIAVYLQNSRVE